MRLAAEAHRSKTGEAFDAQAQQRRAVAWLLGHFVKSRTKHFRDALTRSFKWEENGFAARLDAAFTAHLTPIILKPISLTAAEAVAADREVQVAAATDA